MYADLQVDDEGSQPFQESYPQALSLSALKKIERKAYLRYYLRPGYWGSHVIQSPGRSWRGASLFLKFLLAQ